MDSCLNACIFIVHSAEDINRLSVYCMKSKCTMIVLTKNVLKEALWRVDRLDLSNIVDVRAIS